MPGNPSLSSLILASLLLSACGDADALPAYSSASLQETCGFAQGTGLSEAAEVAGTEAGKICNAVSGEVRALQLPTGVDRGQIRIAALNARGQAAGRVIPDVAVRPWQHLMTVWNADGGVAFASVSPDRWITPGAPAALNSGGEFVGQGVDETGVYWSAASGFLRLPAPTPIAVQRDLGDEGVIVGYGIDTSAEPGRQQRALVWDDPTRESATPYLTPGGPGSRAEAVNAALRVVGCDRRAGEGPLLPRLWQLSRGTAGLALESGRFLDSLGSGCLLDVNARGDAVGYVEEDGRRQAVIYLAQAGRLAPLSALVQDRCIECLGPSEATRINDRGEILLQAGEASYLLRP